MNLDLIPQCEESENRTIDRFCLAHYFRILSIALLSAVLSDKVDIVRRRIYSASDPCPAALSRRLTRGSNEPLSNPASRRARQKVAQHCVGRR